MKSRVVALSAVAAGFVALFLTLGAYISFIDIISVIVASVFVVLPLYLESVLGSVLAFFAGGVIAFLLGGANVFSLVWPAYFLFFGILPILNFIAERKISAKRYGSSSSSYGFWRCAPSSCFITLR